MGRPKTKENDDPVIHVRIPERLLSLLQHKAKTCGLSVAAYMRLALAHSIHKYDPTK